MDTFALSAPQPFQLLPGQRYRLWFWNSVRPVRSPWEFPDYYLWARNTSSTVNVVSLQRQARYLALRGAR